MFFFTHSPFFSDDFFFNFWTDFAQNWSRAVRLREITDGGGPARLSDEGPASVTASRRTSSIIPGRSGSRSQWRFCFSRDRGHETQWLDRWSVRWVDLEAADGSVFPPSPWVRVGWSSDAISEPQPLTSRHRFSRIQQRYSSRRDRTIYPSRPRVNGALLNRPCFVKNKAAMTVHHAPGCLMTLRLLVCCTAGDMQAENLAAFEVTVDKRATCIRSEDTVTCDVLYASSSDEEAEYTPVQPRSPYHHSVSSPGLCWRNSSQHWRSLLHCVPESSTHLCQRLRNTRATTRKEKNTQARFLFPIVARQMRRTIVTPVSLGFVHSSVVSRANRAQNKCICSKWESI